ncbi:MAG: hypothetical protein ACFE9Z_14265 [Promethearchaeota archaeon]
MKVLCKRKKRLKQTSLILILLCLSFIPNYFANFIDFGNNSEESTHTNDNIQEMFNDMDLKTNSLGNVSWWDTSFKYRRIVEISNPYPLDFIDYGVSASFNYSQLIQEGMIYQEDLDDIRIVENYKLRNFYIVKDYPETGLATVYFDTNVSQSTTEFDTYMYFGNDTASNAEAIDPLDSFGWVKNGDFELDVSTDQYFEPYGWTFSHDQVDQIKDISNSREAFNYSADSYIFFENRLVDIDDAEMAERVVSGEYSYKWGGEGTFLPQTACRDYVGTFYSYPFKVPIIQGGLGEISLHVYRNVRTWFFEDEEGSTGISEDGYFLRLCNGSDAKYTADVDLHENIGNLYDSWIETYGGYAYISPNKKTLRYHTELKEHFNIDPSLDTRSGTSSDGDLTGSLEIDLTDYMGEVIFLELGTWGPEDGDTQTQKSGFFQVDDIRFNYTISAEMQESQAQESSIEVIAKDIDGRIVPNAEITLVNNSIAKGAPGYEVATGTTDFTGRIRFTQIPNGRYNITANYTLGTLEEEVYNSYSSGTGPFYFNGISYTKEITLDLWTIDFEIVDWDGNPLSMGYIEVNESLNGDFLKKMTLDQNGRATFRWLNQPSYYFRVYYDHEDYSGNPVLLNESYIYRSDYNKPGVKYQSHSISVKDSNSNPPGENSYSISEYIYTNGSNTEFGYEKIIKFNVSLTSMTDQLEDISIYYIDKYGVTGSSSHLIYFEDVYGPGEDNDFIELDVPLIDNSKLESESFELHGLLIEVNGLNFSQCNGIIEVNTVETCNVYNRTHLARINIQTIDEYDNPISSAIHISDMISGELIELSSSSSTTNGWAFDSEDLPFWYLKDRVYNITIDAYNLTNVEFDIENIDPPQFKPQGITWFNFTLQQNSTIIFRVYLPGVNTSYFLTSFSNSSGTPEAYWGENVTFSLIFEYTEDNGQTWLPVIDPSARCTLYIRRAGTSIDLVEVTMEHDTGSGNFSITFNSNSLSAGSGSRFYNIRIEGTYPGYPDPNNEGFLLEVKAIPTSIRAYDHDTQLELADKTYTAYYNELISVMVFYSISESGDPLEDAYLTYEWLGLAPTRFYADPVYSEYYTFTIDTSDAQTTGLKVISITATYENYSSQSNFLVYLNILERKTTLNGQSEALYYITSTVDVQDQRNFIFTYRDSNTNSIIGDLSTSSYLWEELYSNGTKIPGSFGSGSLSQNLNHSYTLDFNTELKPVGYYFLYVTLKQDNYEQKNAFIYLEIILREFTVTILEPHLGSNNQITLAKGAGLDFEVEIWDDSRDIELQNATVKFNFRGTNYTFNSNPTEPGSYNISILTGNIDTFFTTKTFVGRLYIIASNFTQQEITITITIKMDEIFPGMPTFYFIIITAAIVGIVGSVVAYRVIQQARIPKHVKKIRKVKSLIKSKKAISEIISVPTKEQMMNKLFGNDWKEIGLSLEDTLGISDLKKKSPIKEKLTKDRGEIE